jgi:hypothetical protein
MSVLADRGVELPIPTDGPTVRMVDQQVVREEFCSHTSVDNDGGDPRRKRQLQHLQFRRALDWAETQQLIGVEEIDEVTHLRLVRPNPEDGDEERE